MQGLLEILDFTLWQTGSHYKILSQEMTQSDLYFDRITFAVLGLDRGNKGGSRKTFPGGY